jgi:hypothetical protein
MAVALANLPAREYLKAITDDDWHNLLFDASKVQRYAGLADDDAAYSSLCISGNCRIDSAIQRYLDECNGSSGVDGDAYSTILMVWLLFTLSVLELLLLLKAVIVEVLCKKNFEQDIRRKRSAIWVPTRVVVALLISWTFVICTACDTYSRALRLRKSTDHWNEQAHDVAFGLPACAAGTDCLTQTCPSSAYVLSAKILSADDGGNRILSQFAFCWGMYLLSIVDEALLFANTVAVAVCLLASVRFLWNFRRRAARLATLVQDRYEPMKGWAIGLDKEELALLGPSDGTEYSRGAAAGYYIGVYVFTMAFGYYLWLAVSVLGFWVVASVLSTARPTDLSHSLPAMCVLGVPLIVHAVVKYLTFQLHSRERGMKYPRIGLALDGTLSITSMLSAPFLVLPRTVVTIGTLCVRLLSVDDDVLPGLVLGCGKLLPDFSQAASCGVWTMLRQQYEFEKRRAWDIDHGHMDTFALKEDVASEMQMEPMVVDPSDGYAQRDGENEQQDEDSDQDSQADADYAPEDGADTADPTAAAEAEAASDAEDSD